MFSLIDTVVSIVICTEGVICLENNIFKLAISIIVNLHILTGIQQGLVQAIHVKLHVDASI